MFTLKPGDVVILASNPDQPAVITRLTQNHLDEQVAECIRFTYEELVTHTIPIIALTKLPKNKLPKKRNRSRPYL